MGRVMRYDEMNTVQKQNVLLFGRFVPPEWDKKTTTNVMYYVYKKLNYVPRGCLVMLSLVGLCTWASTSTGRVGWSERDYQYAKRIAKINRAVSAHSCSYMARDRLRREGLISIDGRWIGGE